MTGPTMRVLSLGAGVQSTALLLLAARGELPGLDGAIFSDTGWEPASVYTHLDRLEREVAQPAGIPIHRVSTGNIRADALDPEHRFASMPLFVRNPDGGDGMTRRQCTSEYKLKPIKAKVRELLGYPHPRPVPRGVYVDQWIGISTDERDRAIASDTGELKTGDVNYARNRYPLLDLDMSREHCRALLTKHGFGLTPKSACIGCPFHTNRQWRTLRDTCKCGHHRDSHGKYGPWCNTPGSTPAANLRNDSLCDCPRFESPEWEDAVDFDAAIRAGSARATANGQNLIGQAFLHRSRLPLSVAPVDRVTRAEWAGRQGDLVHDLAMTDYEDSLTDDEDAQLGGCSPFGCGTGAAS